MTVKYISLGEQIGKDFMDIFEVIFLFLHKKNVFLEAGIASLMGFDIFTWGSQNYTSVIIKKT